MTSQDATNADAAGGQVAAIGRGRIEPGETRELIEGALEIARQRLLMEIAWVAELTEDLKIFRVVTGDRDGWGIDDDSYMPGGDSFCRRMLDGQIPNAVPDALEHPSLQDLEVTRRLAIRAYLAIPLVLRDGEVYGALCCASRQPDQGLGELEVSFLQVLGRLVARQLDLQSEERRLRYLEAQNSAITALSAALDARDSYTAEHSRSVVDLAVRVGRRLSLDEGQLADVRQVATLHDIGKVAIPDVILRKQGPLDPEEVGVMRQHPAEGARIVAEIGPLAHLAPAIHAEHERWDGQGYPQGLSGEAIPVASRITFACDTFDAMTSDRPYRAALPLSQAIAELESNSGAQFWPEAVHALLAEIRP